MKLISKKLSTVATAGALLLGTWASASAEELKVGVIIAQTGMAANFGKSVSSAVALWPKEIDGTPVKLIIRDDRSDVTTSTTMTRQLITDEKVDVVVGLLLTPSAVANAPVAEEAQVPYISTSPVPGAGKWLFDMAVPVSQNAKMILDRMVVDGVKTVGMIGYSDTWGDQWIAQLREQGAKLGIEVVADERYARADTSVTGQALKLISLAPDAVFVAASYAGAAVPVVELRDRGYAGKIYHSNGMERVSYMNAAGAAGEGVMFATTPFDLAGELPDANPSKAVALEFHEEFKKTYAADVVATVNTAQAYDVGRLLIAAVPKAKKIAKVGTPEFHDAMRVALEQTSVVGSAGTYEFSADNHYGLSNGSGVILGTIADGKWTLLAD